MRVETFPISAAVLALGLAVSSPWLWAQQTPSNWSDAEKEAFLLRAKVKKTKEVSTGVTRTRRATLSDGQYTHDASVQTIDVYKRSAPTADGTELNFRDCYKYNIAAYRLDRLLNLNMIPVSVERRIKGKTAAVTWWVEDVEMMEKERRQKKIRPPRVAAWLDQRMQARVFNELVYNTDANLGNQLITKDWRLVLIDFSRSFRRHKTLRQAKNLKPGKLDRRLYDGLRTLKKRQVEKRLGNMLLEPEIEGLMGRRDKIVDYFDQQIAERGEIYVLCSLPGH